jgi:hypothetical protein
MKAGLFVSHDGAATFEENDAVPGVVALAQRAGVLFAATDNYANGYALGASSDGGVTWQPVVRFDQIRSIMACLQTNAQCQASCEALAGNGLGSSGQIWDQAVCATGGAPSGAGGASAGGASGSGLDGGSANAGTSGHGPSGGGCALAPRPPSPWPTRTISAAVVGGAIALSRRRWRRRCAVPSRSRRWPPSGRPPSDR